MRLIDVVSAPWAITPEMFQEVQGIYTRHCRGEKIDLGAVEAKVGRPLANRTKPVEKVGSVAVIPVQGVLAKKANLFMDISGGTSMQMMGDQLAQALDDPSVTAIVLDIDSPGGTVDGTQALADQIYAARGKKPMTAYTDGMICSAAYWIASATDAIYINDDTTQVGSIGVIATHVDQGMAEAAQGIRVTEVTAGKFKGSGSPHKGLGAAEVVLQERVDHLYDVFTGAVARNRGVSVEQVKSDMAEGQVFSGRKAIDAGLVDGVATLTQVIASAAAAGRPDAQLSADSAAVSAGVAPQATQTNEDPTMLTIEQVRAEAPAVAAALVAEGAAAAKAEGFAAGATAERERIQAVGKMTRKGCEALVAEMQADGKTTAPEAAVRILAAIDAKNQGKLDALTADAGAVDVAAAAVAGTEQTAADKAAKIDPIATATAAQNYKRERAAAGITVSDVEAVDHVLKGAK